MRRSLYWQFAVPMIVVILLLLAGLTIYFSNYLEKTYLADLEGDLKTQSILLAREVAPMIETGYPYEGLNPLVQEYARVTGARVTVVLLQGIVVADSTADPAAMDNHLDRPEIQKALVNGYGSEVRFSDTLLKSFLYVAVPVVRDQKVIGFVRLADSLEEIESGLASLRRTLVGSSALAGAAVILLSFLIANRALSPLRELAREVRRLGSGVTTLDLPAARRDEVGLLAQSFGEIAEQLNDQMEGFKEERAKLKAVLRNMTDAVLIVSEQGKVTLINPAAERIFNTRAEHALGQTLVEVVRLHQFVDLWKSSLSSGRQQIVTIETTPDRLFIQGIATPLGESLPGSTLLVFQDLTRLRRLENVRRDFVSNVSHELRTPLASMKAVTETLKDGALEDPTAAQRFLQHLEDEIDNMTQTVQELLELSRIESGQVPFNLKPVEPLQLLTRAAERMALQAERSGLRLAVDCPADLPAVRADAERIEQVLINLLHNAVKFTPSGGEIEVSARKEGGWVQFSVRDTGVGIQPEDLPRVFERFYKADQSRSGGGTGLGLSIARHTVEAHGGRIWAESLPGKGSTFSFTLPLA
jgi:two-component system phosphate regulon sensor histidine kinase PhoR